MGWLNHDTPLIEWTQPSAEQAARNLIELGAKAVIFAPIGFATENHETILDVHHIIHRLERRHPQAQFIQMDCVNDEPDFLAMASQWAVEQIDALLLTSSVQEEKNLLHHPHHHHHNGYAHSHSHNH